MRELQAKVSNLDVTLVWKDWSKSPGDLLIWEAFVSQQAHTKDDVHVDDAITAATRFHHIYKEKGRHLTSALPVSSDRKDDQISLIGAAIMWAGIRSDPSLLRAHVLCVRPEQAYDANEVSTKLSHE